VALTSAELYADTDR